MEFNYIAIDSKGKRVKGVFEANKTEDVVDHLINQGLTVVSVTEKIGINLDKLSNTNIGGIPLKDKFITVKQFATMIKAGIPLIQSLDILIQQTESKAIKEKLKSVYKGVESGMTLSDAFRKEAGIFNEVQVSLLSSGEQSGNLSEMLEQIATDMENTRNLRGKFRGALIYPVIIFSVMGIVLFILVTFLIPQIKEIYSSLGQSELPFVTNILVSIGEFMSNPVSVVFIVLFLVSAYILYVYLNSTPEGKYKIDFLKLKIPVFGKLSQKIEVTQFCKVLSMLLKGGIPIIEAIDITSKALGNAVFSTALLNSKAELIRGNSLALSIAKFDKKKVFPLVLLRIIATGEEAGKLDHVIADMGKFYESEVEQITSNLTKLMEPMIMLVAGIMVAILAVGVYLPIFQVGQAVSS